MICLEDEVKILSFFKILQSEGKYGTNISVYMRNDYFPAILLKTGRILKNKILILTCVMTN